MALGCYLVCVQADTVVRWQRERFPRCNRCHMPERSGTGYVADLRLVRLLDGALRPVHGIGILELHGYRSTSTGQRHLLEYQRQIAALTRFIHGKISALLAGVGRPSENAGVAGADRHLRRQDQFGLRSVRDRT